MISPESRAVFSALQNKAAHPQVLFVGGCVRNAVLGLPPGDCDLATIHPPFEVTRRLEDVGIKVVPTGIDHGTVTAVVDGKPFEITTLRRDVETDGRHAVVSFTQDWSLDAQRRDFTINTLLADGAGNLYDPTGDGLSDLEAGRVVFVGDPVQRIAEDYLRILRFFRFYAFYGRGRPDAAALAACRAAAGKIADLSRERVTQEILKIIAADGAADILEIMAAQNVMKDFVHPQCKIANLAMLAGLQKRLGPFHLLRLLPGWPFFVRVILTIFCD
jgi:poly(A) polymerase